MDEVETDNENTVDALKVDLSMSGEQLTMMMWSRRDLARPQGPSGRQGILGRSREGRREMDKSCRKKKDKYSWH